MVAYRPKVPGSIPVSDVEFLSSEELINSMYGQGVHVFALILPRIVFD